ncbi:MAG: hypothetical protein ACXIVQ_10715 [Acidimicrobiales bacterium]
MRRPLTIALSALLVLAVACGDDDSTPAASGNGGDDSPAVVAVSLEELDGVMIEGFEIGLRFETADGEVIDSMLWSEVVAGSGDDSIDAFYDTVHEQEVPAGAVTVLATVNVGIGPPPETPDLAGPMDCQLELDLEPGERAQVEVSFDGTDDCLRQL